MEKSKINNGPSAKFGIASPNNVKYTNSAIHAASSPVRRQNARRHGDRGANKKRKKRQLQRRRVALKNNPPHRRLKFQRLPQVAMSKLPKIVSILRR